MVEAIRPGRDENDLPWRAGINGGPYHIGSVNGSGAKSRRVNRYPNGFAIGNSSRYADRYSGSPISTATGGDYLSNGWG
jgi:hypothetical protein